MQAQARHRGKSASLNSFGPGAQVLFHVLLALFSLLCIVPFLFVIIISFTSEDSIRQIGYSFVPLSWGTQAYKYVFELGDTLWRSYFNSFLITVIGTVLSVAMCVLYAYPLFRKDFKFRGFFNFLSFFTMIFGGESRDPRAVRKKITAAILDAQKNGLDEAMFNECKKTTYGSLVRELNNVSAVNNALVSSHMAGCGLYDTMQVLSEMTLEDCNRFLREETDTARMTLSIIAPAK